MVYYDPVEGRCKVCISREELRAMLDWWESLPETKALFARIDAEMKERVAKFIAEAKEKEKRKKQAIKTLADIKRRSR